MFLSLLSGLALASVDIRTTPFEGVLATGDLNGDGAPDLVQAYQDYGVIPWYGDGSGLFEPGPLVAFPTLSLFCSEGADNAHGASIGDLDGDGAAELVIHSSNGWDGCFLYQTLPGSPAGLLNGPVRVRYFDDMAFPIVRFVGDDDLDGDEEMVIQYALGPAWDDYWVMDYHWDGRYFDVADGDGYNRAWSYTISEVEVIPRAGDTNGDGQADYLFANDGDLGVSWMPGPRVFLDEPNEADRAWSWTPVGGPEDQWHIASHAWWVDGTGDNNLDGYADMVAWHASGHQWMSWFAGGPDGYGPGPAGELRPSWADALGLAAATADMDGDGEAEVVLLATDRAGGASLLFFDAGPGVRSADYALALAPLAPLTHQHQLLVAAGDLDGSGADDLIVRGRVVLAPDCGPSGPQRWYVDGDGDGFADASRAIIACAAPAGATPVTGDCDDTDPLVHIGALEPEQGVDNDCDGLVVGREDLDGDGWSGAPVVLAAFTVPNALRDPPGDCDDHNRSIRPGSWEAPLTDTNCDGVVTCYADADGDGAGSTSTVPALGPSCDDPAHGRADAADDCDDTDPLVVGRLYYTDDDQDGYGGYGRLACSQPAGQASLAGDCNDRDATISPGSAEIVGGPDEDCDGQVLCYRDDDQDGTGSTLEETTGWTCTRGWSSLTGDCDDHDGDRAPGRRESVDAHDNNCDNLWLCYIDDDQDGYGQEVTALIPTSCVTPGHAQRAGDCDDTNGQINPSARERYGGPDEDCDGWVYCYRDSDRDGYGGTTSVFKDWGTCDGQVGYSAWPDDCDDYNAARHPDLPEVLGGPDEDCDGRALCVADADLDGAGGPVQEQAPPCALGLLVADEDCDDHDPRVWPGAPELYGEDLNCDGLERCVVDQDGDGYGVSSQTVELPSCDVPGVAVMSRDCDDADPSAHPGQVEVLGNAFDEDCTGQDGFAMTVRVRRARRELEVDLSGLPPRTPVRVYASGAGPGSGPCVQPGQPCGGLAQPHLADGGVTDASGQATLSVVVPQGTNLVWLQGFAWVDGQTGRTLVLPAALPSFGI